MAIARVNGFAGAFENVSRNIQYYTVYAKSPNAFSDPSLATGVNIKVTGNYADISQKCFEVLLQSIGLRAMPVLMSEPVAYARLEDQGAPTLCGEGFVWKFATEMPYVYENFSKKGTPSDNLIYSSTIISKNI